MVIPLCLQISGPAADAQSLAVLTSLRSFCLRLPRATSPKPASGSGLGTLLGSSSPLAGCNYPHDYPTVKIQVGRPGGAASSFASLRASRGEASGPPADAENHNLNRTVNYRGRIGLILSANAVSCAGRSLPQRRPAISLRSKACTAGCDPKHSDRPQQFGNNRTVNQPFVRCRRAALRGL